MYDILELIHDEIADTYFLGKTLNNTFIEFDGFSPFKSKAESVNEAISYAMYKFNNPQI